MTSKRCRAGPCSLAGQQAAEKLLTNARRALDKHDEASAATFIGRAVQLPLNATESATAGYGIAQPEATSTCIDADGRSTADPEVHPLRGSKIWVPELIR